MFDDVEAAHVWGKKKPMGNKKSDSRKKSDCHKSHSQNSCKNIT